MNILAFGEILWDILPSGKKCGGAPANFAYHCRQMGADARILSRVGADPLGEELLAFCRQLNLDTRMIGVDRDLPTGTVTVKLNAGGLPVYTIHENVAWDALEAVPEAVAWAADADVLCFGSLAARGEKNRRALAAILDAAKPDALRVLDLNLRNPFCEKENLEFVLSRANVLKLNDEELVRISRMFSLEGETLEERISGIFHASALPGSENLRMMIVTCGADGSWLATKTERVFTPGQAVNVVDTVGAGDAFTAAVAMGTLRGRPLPEIGEWATTLAGYVCTQAGATPAIPEGIKPPFSAQ